MGQTTAHLEALEVNEAFARYAAEAGLARPDQIDAARGELARLEREGRTVSLAEALVILSILTVEQREDAEKKLRARKSGELQILGQYKLLQKLGAGAMGAVYLAEDTVMRRKVAIKVLLQKHGEDPRFLARFRREVRAAGKLNHPHIAAGYAVGEEQGQHYYVMEYCEGEALDTMLKRTGPWPVEQVLESACQIVRGLLYAHRLGFVHRDIKPENIILTLDGVAKILDLGLSKDLLDAEKSFNTQTGMLLGTPHYISPEQAQAAKDVDGRSDIYSLGATLYHLLTGQTPFHGVTAASLVMQHLSEPTPNPRELRPDIPDSVAQVIRKMTAKEPAARYLDCAELLADLECLQAGKPPAHASQETLKSTVSTQLNVPLVELEKKRPPKSAPEMFAPAATLDPWPDQPLDPPLEGKRQAMPVWALLCGTLALALLAGLAITRFLPQEKRALTEKPPAAGASPQLPEKRPFEPPSNPAGSPHTAPLPSLPAGLTPEASTPAKRPTPVLETPPRPQPILEAKNESVYLSDLAEMDLRTIDARNALFEKWCFGKGHFGKNGVPIEVRGKPSPHGLAMGVVLARTSVHVAYALNKGYRSFESEAAINDSARQSRTGGSATPLIFKVLGDRKELWRSEPLQKAGQSQACSVDVSGVQNLELIVDCPGEWLYAQGVWIEPRVLPAQEAPQK